MFRVLFTSTWLVLQSLGHSLLSLLVGGNYAGNTECLSYSRCLALFLAEAGLKTQTAGNQCYQLAGVKRNKQLASISALGGLGGPSRDSPKLLRPVLQLVVY